MFYNNKYFIYFNILNIFKKFNRKYKYNTKYILILNNNTLFLYI